MLIGNNAVFTITMLHTFVEENIKSLIMTYKVKSLAYLVVFTTLAFTYHITDTNEKTIFVDNIEEPGTENNNSITAAYTLDKR